MKKKVEVHSREDGADIEEGENKWIVGEELDQRGHKKSLLDPANQYLQDCTSREVSLH